MSSCEWMMGNMFGGMLELLDLATSAKFVVLASAEKMPSSLSNKLSVK